MYFIKGIEFEFSSTFSSFYKLEYVLLSSDRSKSPGVHWREGVVVSGSLEDLIHELVPRLVDR